VGDLDRHLDAPLVLAGDLALAQEADRLAQGQLAPGGLVEQRVELIADRRQLQPGQHADQGLVVERHHQPPQPAVRSRTAAATAPPQSPAGW
jgi:hypothetical protein